MKKNLKGLLALSLVSLLTACSAQNAVSENYNASTVTNDSVSEEVRKADEAYYASQDAASTDTEASGDSGTAEGAADDDTLWTASDDEESVLTYSANLTIQTRNYDESWSVIKGALTKSEGFLSSESQWSDSSLNPELKDDPSNGVHGYYELRVPTENLESFIQEASESGNVTSLSRSAQNITKAYNDNADQIAFCKTKLKKIQDLLSKAKTVSDIADLEQKEMDVQHELNALQNTKSSMDLDIKYSTVYLSLDQVAIYSSAGESFGDKIATAFVNTWVVLMNGLQTIVIGIIYLIPWAILIGIVYFIVRFFLKKRRKLKAGPEELLSDAEVLYPAGTDSEKSENPADTEGNSEMPVQAEETDQPELNDTKSSEAENGQQNESASAPEDNSSAENGEEKAADSKKKEED